MCSCTKHEAPTQEPSEVYFEVEAYLVEMNVAPNDFPPPLLMSDPGAPFNPGSNFCPFSFSTFHFCKNLI